MTGKMDSDPIAMKLTVFLAERFLLLLLAANVCPNVWF